MARLCDIKKLHFDFCKSEYFVYMRIYIYINICPLYMRNILSTARFFAHGMLMVHNGLLATGEGTSMMYVIYATIFTFI